MAWCYTRAGTARTSTFLPLVYTLFLFVSDTIAMSHLSTIPHNRLIKHVKIME